MAINPGNASPQLLELRASAAQDARHAGTKAARLALMVQAGFPVPPAFVVSAEVFSAFCRQHGLPAPWTAGSSIAAQRFAELELPAALGTAIQQAVTRLGSPLLAVRSSGTVEDLDDFSLAGQFDTFLNTPAAQVGIKVKQCWASLYAEAPSAYGQKLRLVEAPRMAVLVQAQVLPRWAGVVFTVDPVTKSADRFVIEWVVGQGDQLVAGQVTPRRLHVPRERPDLPQELAPELRDTLRQVWHWARQAERLFQQPIDMEWAADERGLHVLQARPITGLCGPETVVWTNVNMAENFPHPLTPLAFSLVDGFYGVYIRSILRAFGWREAQLRQAAGIIGNLTGVQGGRIYYNLSNWYALLGYFPCSAWLIQSLNHYIGQKIPYRYTPRPEASPIQSRGLRWLAAAAFWPRLFKSLRATGRRMTALEALFMCQRRHWRRVRYSRLSAAQLLAQLSDVLGFVDRCWAPSAMADVAVMIVPALVDRLTRRWLPAEAPQAEAQLYKGMDLISMQPSVLIWQCAQQIKTQASLLDLLRSGQYARLEENLPESVRRLVARFMDRFGGRCFHDCMLVAPTFEERHDIFWELVKSYATADIGHPLEQLDRHRDEQRNYVQCVLARLDLWQRWLYAPALRQARQAVALRERGRLLQSLLFGELRRIAMALGQRFKAQGAIEEAEAIFYLQLDEIQKILDGKFHLPATLAALIAERRAALERCSTLEPPSFFFLEPGEVARHDRPRGLNTAAGDLWQGTGVSRGVVRAPARIIRDPLSSGHLNHGDILVTHATDPGWTPLFSICGGLVLERGGMLSHGAIVAREFGIPAVVGIEHATRDIVEGSLLIVDGDRGTVQPQR